MLSFLQIEKSNKKTNETLEAGPSFKTDASTNANEAWNRTTAAAAGAPGGVAAAGFADASRSASDGAARDAAWTFAAGDGARCASTASF